MSSLNVIKGKINSTKNTAQITNAMRMVSAAKYNRIAEDAGVFFVYLQRLRRMIADLASSQIDALEADPTGQTSSHDIDFNKMLIERPIKRVGYIIISSDKGLAGNYNSSLFSAVEQMLEETHDQKEKAVILAIGEPGATHFERLGYEVAHATYDISDQPTFTEVQSIVRRAITYYEDEKFDALRILYNHHVNALHHEFHIDNVLPLVTDQLKQEDTRSVETDYIIEPDANTVLDILLPQYAQSQIYGAILDAKSAEHASRMNAMQAATDNANEIVGDLTLQYNQMRQLQVTNDILDIINGANAIEQEEEGN